MCGDRQAISVTIRRCCQLLLAALLSLLLSTQARAPLACRGEDDCPVPGVYGRQPFPSELVAVFESAGTNRLGDDSPTLPQLSAGYPPPEARLVSPYVPCILLKAIGYTESTGWKQFDAAYGELGYTVVSGDCGYGIMQITSGMAGGAGFEPVWVAAVPAYNIGTGALLLIQKWNGLSAYIGTSNPYVVEDWYYATWAYNGWGWVNNPNHNCPDNDPNCGYGFHPFRSSFDGTQPRSWYPYQEVVWGYAAHPPSTEFWEAVPLTLPPRGSITNPPLAHIDTPEPSHRSCSVAYLPAILANSPSCTQQVLNGEFEVGSAYWVQDGAVTISPYTPHLGSYSAWFGGYNNANDVLYQTVTIPASGPTGHPILSAQLRYDWSMSTEETSHSYDNLFVKIRDAYGNDLTNLETLSDGSIANTWTLSSHDVSAYVGETIQVHYRGTTDGSYITSFFLDDVTLYACEED